MLIFASEQQSTLLQRLEGLPLALAQAGSFLRTTRMSLEEYLTLYDGSRRQLLESHRSLFGTGEGNLRGNIRTTWSLSLADLEQRASLDNKYDNALKLLQLITFFDPTDIDFTILCRGLIGPQVPDWCEAVFESPLSFVTTAELLVERSLLNRTSKYACYSMHRVVYDWLCAEEENEVDEGMLTIAMSAIAFSAPGSRSQSWRQSEQRLIAHVMAMEKTLLRCKFATGVALVELGALTPPNFERAIRLVRDPEWYKEITDARPPLSTMIYIFSIDEKVETGLQIVEAALTSVDREGFRETQTLASLLEAKAILLLRQKKFPASRACCFKALALPNKSRLLQYDLQLTLAAVMGSEDKVPHASRMLDTCILEARKAGLAFNHPWILAAIVQLEWILSKSKSATFDAAGRRVRLLEPYRTYAEETASRSAASRGILSSLGNAYRDMKAHDKALVVLEAVLAAELASATASLSRLVDVYYDLHRAYLGLGKTPEALSFCEKWSEAQEARFGAKSKKTGYALSDLCLMSHNAHDATKALEAGMRAADILGPEDGVEYLYLSWALRDVYIREKKWGEATTWARRAVEVCAIECGAESALCKEDKETLEKIAQLETEDMARNLQNPPRYEMG